ncbi:hypothetical protein BDP81DRAFT_393276 [Colletotrichum phormii]|uniref:Dynamin N-terminal domain-containing protein n=1 Tax=Colletotrichum phormii TaxID=359342 RepID=A0AAJ0EEY3_9PEZI|nr:uncharacterized protein BDP81DRAFT_393276 [Colletotrichum phormii]KAK1637567.1 hypothetical protein BDP81DRAFT_393276 [Colletotrichum phormii]
MSPVGVSPESQVDSAAGSEAASPTSDKDGEQDEADVIPENPFDSESSRLVIVGGQSTGKSSLLQSLTDIPFPVGSGCCTRFATRIVSRRTAPGSRSSVKVPNVEPDIPSGAE